MIKIVFICHGNICRSTMAEYVMKDLAQKEGIYNQFYISSAAVSTEELGNDIYTGTKNILRKYNIPFDKHSASLISIDRYKDNDLVIVMDESNIRLLNRILDRENNIDKSKIHKLMEYCDSDKDVADPWYTRDFEATYNDISRACKALLNKLK